MWEISISLFSPLLGWAMFQTFFAIIAILVQATGIALAVHALFHSRTPPAAIGWGLGLILLPLLAIPIYLVFGQSKFSGYLLAGHGVVPELDDVKHRIKVALEPHREMFREGFEDLTRLCERLSGLPATKGNALELLVDGEQTFPAIFESIRQAKSYVVVQFFIIRDDGTGEELKKCLLDVLARGVRVFVLFDGVGSKNLPEAYCRKLRNAGAKVLPFVTNRKLGVRFQINFRNHRKLVVVDGKEAFTGGLNIGDEYRSLGKKLRPWRDTHLRVRGPAIFPLLLGFFEDWYYASGEVPEIPIPEISGIEGGSSALSFVSGPADDIEICPVIYLSAIREARRRIWIASPYLVPDTATRIALQHAALRGVDVRILLPGTPDHKLPWLTSFSYYPMLRQAGIRVFRTKKGFMHTKALLVDNDISMIGSINFDHRSFLLNFEHGVMACDERFALKVQQMLLHDFDNSLEEDLWKYERGSFLFRLKVRLAALSSPEQ